ncbi:hypothetical protein W97_05901 [Coniosporium apollinis CBS 100218]|uniref:CFEM domain-containing protein n=1 Tax=Coniosporium apollinis (strain CBS 100218) TaxID=1168221 RepID=R7YXK1_CONA1|nr:uncharacterized protein W97_05901 [Coniosporium apollinis CBS 100218]EON66655.1 hypothetical protein W97_05901 [Coniosporium apollinis CBS 100218]
MRFSALALAACFGALAVAQSTSIADLPVCARNCVGSNLGGCNPIDVRCICSNTDYISGLSCCVLNSCSPEDQQRTIDFALERTECVKFGIQRRFLCSLVSFVFSGIPSSFRDVNRRICSAGYNKRGVT